MYLGRAVLFCADVSAAKSVARGQQRAHRHRMTDLEVVAKTFVDQ